ncbi:energy transducer TonB [Parasaccharibacter sp. TMW2.1890]|uniref:energy transducer TonB n=1 Tax=Parasaccharibacter sp. TMW2.1890 TaxID=2039289 RepID=UPI002013715B|nr:energy transducer TonB [Parasaccharibacter sp. TMW2.1890]MCL1515219.1 hypothetical protein [Parasaccharibacter sp. TMW2.1890]
MSGTLALIFLLWGPATQPGNPPSYTRSVLAPGDERYTLPPNTPNREFYLARNRLQQGYNPQGGTPVGYDFSTLPANTLPECQSYLRSHYRFFEEAAESENRVIQDARCVLIPPGKILGVFHDGGYDDAGKQVDAFALLDIPAAPKQEGPACARITYPDWPQEAQEDNVEGHVDARCEIYEDSDGYRRNRNCTVVKKKKNNHFTELYDNAVLDFVNIACWKGEPSPDPQGQPHLWHYDFTFND